jgi:hypothetical protein
VEAHDGVEEGVSDRRRGIWVCQRNEMGGLGESVDHGEDHRFAIDPWQPFDEDHGQVSPHCARQVQRL